MEQISSIIRVGPGHGMSLEAMAGNPSIPEEDKQAEALRQFEGILLREVLRDTVESMVGAGIEGGQTQKAVYSHWMANQLIDSLTAGGGLGIARTVQEALQLRHDEAGPEAAATVGKAPRNEENE